MEAVKPQQGAIITKYRTTVYFGGKKCSFPFTSWLQKVKG